MAGLADYETHDLVQELMNRGRAKAKQQEKHFIKMYIEMQILGPVLDVEFETFEHQLFTFTVEEF